MNPDTADCIHFEDLSATQKQLIRRLFDSFMLTSGALESLPDISMQAALSPLSCIFQHHLTEVIGLSEQHILKDTLSQAEHISIRWQSTLMIVIGCTLLGQRPVREMLTQALEDLGDLEELGCLFMACAVKRLKGTEE